LSPKIGEIAENCDHNIDPSFVNLSQRFVLKNRSFQDSPIFRIERGFQTLLKVLLDFFLRSGLFPENLFSSFFFFCKRGKTKIGIGSHYVPPQFIKTIMSVFSKTTIDKKQTQTYLLFFSFFVIVESMMWKKQLLGIYVLEISVF
jgi:hypothetical protein